MRLASGNAIFGGGRRKKVGNPIGDPVGGRDAPIRYMNGIAKKAFSSIPYLPPLYNNHVQEEEEEEEKEEEEEEEED